jgi:SAM-dependent methyltransferase
MTRCLICNQQAPFFQQDKRRAYYCCEHCGLVFAEPKSHLMLTAERQRYGRAQKASKQRQLSQFVMQLLTQLGELTGEHLQGLNFGRVLDSNSLDKIHAAGHTLNQYDPFFAANLSALQTQYDFVCSYRVFEHFKQPLQEWALLSRLVKPNGWLAISTPLLKDLNLFTKWHYKNNPTHVSFYQHKTFEYLANQGGFTLLFAAQELVLMQKASGSDIKPNLI